MAVTILPTILAVLAAASAIPITYIYSTYTSELNDKARLGIVGAILFVLYQFTYLLTRNRVKGKIFYVFIIMCFTCGVDLLFALEVNGYIDGFISLYLDKGEPYLDCIPTSMHCLLHGTVGLLSYIIIVYRHSNGYTFKNLGLFMSASGLNRMVVVLVAISLGEPQWHIFTLTNVPFIIFLVSVIVSSFNEEKQSEESNRSSGFIDKLLALLLVGAATAALIKGLVCLGNISPLTLWYENDVEPMLKDTIPAPYPYVQGLVSFFYFLPAYLVLAGALFKNPGQEWAKNLSFILAGATLNAGVMVIGSSIHPLTEPEYRAPVDSKNPTFVAFWSANLLMVLTPQLIALRLRSKGGKGRKGLDIKNQYKKRN